MLSCSDKSFDIICFANKQSIKQVRKRKTQLPAATQPLRLKKTYDVIKSGFYLEQKIKVDLPAE